MNRPSHRWTRWPLAAGAALAAAAVALAPPVVGATSKTATTRATAKTTAKAARAKTTAAKTTAAKTTAPKTTAAGTTAKTTAKAPAADGTTRVEVPSRPGQYFVLYARTSRTGPELPVAIAEAGPGSTTVLTDRRSQLPASAYRVATFTTASPGDADGDGVDDITELRTPARHSPLNSADGAALDPSDGAVFLADKAMFETFSYEGDEVSRDAYLAGQEFVKFWIVGSDTAQPGVYFMNTENWRAHPMFASVVGLSAGRGRNTPGTMRGDVVFEPNGKAPDGSRGTYRFAFQPNDAFSFSEVATAYEVLVANMAFLRNNLSYNTLNGPAQWRYEAEKASYDAYRVPVVAIG